MSDDLEAERERVAQRLRRVREQVRQRSRLEGATLPEPRPVETQDPGPLPDVPGLPPPPERPDGRAVNALWPAAPEAPVAGLVGRIGRWLRRALAPHLDAQVAFNSRQVRFDNETLEYIDDRFAATHRHYDDVLGRYGRHLGEIDERHMILQEELVAHVHDLVKRIDLVLGEAERGRLDLEHALEEVRERLRLLEERLRGA